ncbi:MAG: DUF4149 domain-containing protein [Chloroflexaceae bacterium]|nr:DUF4149 domain-containing protein [Chloroflexaceae bacterium]
MNAIVHSRSKSEVWLAAVLLTLGFWLSASLLLDAVIVPCLSAAGMMAEAGFASTGYLIFGLFNHVELLCAAFVLVGTLVLTSDCLDRSQAKGAIALSLAMLAVVLLCTFVLTPQMSGLALALNQFATPAPMSSSLLLLHGVYWGLEGVKLLAGTALLLWHYRSLRAAA